MQFSEWRAKEWHKAKVKWLDMLANGTLKWTKARENDVLSAYEKCLEMIGYRSSVATFVLNLKEWLANLSEADYKASGIDAEYQKLSFDAQAEALELGAILSASKLGQNYWIPYRSYLYVATLVELVCLAIAAKIGYCPCSKVFELLGLFYDFVTFNSNRSATRGGNIGQFITDMHKDAFESALEKEGILDPPLLRAFKEAIAKPLK